MVSSRTGVRIPLRTFHLKEMLARASYYKHVSLGPQDLDRSLGRHVRPYTETRQPIRPKDPAVPRGGECYKAYLGWVIDRSFTPVARWVTPSQMGYLLCFTKMHATPTSHTSISSVAVLSVPSNKSFYTATTNDICLLVLPIYSINRVSTGVQFCIKN